MYRTIFSRPGSASAKRAGLSILAVILVVIAGLAAWGRYGRTGEIASEQAEPAAPTKQLEEQPGQATELLERLKQLEIALKEHEESLTKRAEEVKSLSSTLSLAGAPVGAIMPYYGDPASLEGTGWVLCDGRTVKSSDPRLKDADPKTPGIQVPDLRGRFLKAAGNLGERGGASVANIQFTHAHRWTMFRGGTNWWSFDAQGREFQVTCWADGHTDTGRNNFSIARDVSQQGRDELTLYTDIHSRNVTVNTEPPYVCVYFIIRTQ